MRQARDSLRGHASTTVNDDNTDMDEDEQLQRALTMSFVEMHAQIHTTQQTPTALVNGRWVQPSSSGCYDRRNDHQRDGARVDRELERALVDTHRHAMPSTSDRTTIPRVAESQRSDKVSCTKTPPTLSSTESGVVPRGQKKQPSRTYENPVDDLFGQELDEINDFLLAVEIQEEQGSLMP